MLSSLNIHHTACTGTNTAQVQLVGFIVRKAQLKGGCAVLPGLGGQNDRDVVLRLNGVTMIVACKDKSEFAGGIGEIKGGAIESVGAAGVLAYNFIVCTKQARI